MKILQLCHKPPIPPVDGGCIAINNVTQGLLKSGHQVKVVAISTPKHPVKWNEFSEEYLQKTQFESVYIDTAINNISAIKSLLLGTSYHITRFVSKEFIQRLTQILKKESFDIVQLESIFVAPYIQIIRQHSEAKIVLRTHNIEHQIWERIVQNEKWWTKKWVLKQLTKHLKKYECSLFDKVDGFMAITMLDYQFFHQLSPQAKGITVPFGINLTQYEPEEDYIPSDNPELFHIGSMNWLPNIEGIEWFLDEVWNLLLEKFPHLTFTIAGRDIPKSIKNRNVRNVTIVENVVNANEFMLSKDIMIVPLWSGSGVRIKIIEGMALGKTIITTSIGAEGIMVENGKNIFIADTPEEFVNTIEKCIKTPDLCTIIGENARNYIALHHNNDVITEEILRFYQDVLKS